MTSVALFHSALGVRRGVIDLADALRSAGHDVTVIDQYQGCVFDRYDDGLAYVEEVGGFPVLMASALTGAAGVEGRFVAAGFSNGAGMAQWVASQRPTEVSGVVMLGGGLPMSVLGAPWPTGVPGQLHCTSGDPWHKKESDPLIRADADAAGASIEFFDYPGDGHLFSDPTLPDEYQPAEAARMTQRVLDFVASRT